MKKIVILFTILLTTVTFPAAAEEEKKTDPLKYDFERYRLGGDMLYCVSAKDSTGDFGIDLYGEIKLTDIFRLRTLAGHIWSEAKFNSLSKSNYKMYWFEEMVITNLPFLKVNEQSRHYIGIAAAYCKPVHKLGAGLQDEKYNKYGIRYEEHLDAGFGVVCEAGLEMKMQKNHKLPHFLFNVKYIYFKPELSGTSRFASGRVIRLKKKADLSTVVIGMGVSFPF